MANVDSIFGTGTIKNHKGAKAKEDGIQNILSYLFN